MYVACLVIAACGGGGDSPASTEIAAWSVGADPVVSIGGDDDRPDYLVYGVVNATRLSDGRIAVGLQGSSQVKYFNRVGVHVSTAGGEGDGPGEFRGIFSMVRSDGDSLILLSRSPGLTWLSPSGDYLDSSSFDIWSIGSQPCRIGEGNWHPLGDGSLLAVMEDNFGNPGCPVTPPSPWRQSALIGRQDPTREGFDTVAIVPGTERNSPNYRVYGKSALIASGPDRLYVTDTGSDTILVLGYDGDTLDVFTTPFDVLSVPQFAKDADVRRFTGRDGAEKIGNAYDYPETYPRIGRLVLDTSGNLWVMAYPSIGGQISSWRLASTYAFLVEEGGARWTVLSPAGDVIAHVRTPPGLFPLEIGEDYVLGVSKDEYDVESVELYTLAR